MGNTKGGVGKTTVATNLAIHHANAGGDVLLVDGDEQGSAATFTELRASGRPDRNPGYTCVRLEGAALRTQVRALTPKYDTIIIDVGGQNTGSLRAALTVSHAVLIPVQPRTLDVWATDQIVELVGEARAVNPELRALAFVNLADPQGLAGKDNRDTLAALRDTAGIEALDAMLVRRKSFANAIAAGLGVTEQVGRDRDARAVEELLALVAAV
ncbi:MULTISPECIES: AAA family ATPase [unclassified Azospirillum]|uniref:AAA family ATPase n=1 Tax=unclassified Azospirillum TaxID=2630922 RepID=UPI002000094B|nr:MULTISPECIES: AAA family ATPase [unclassified Azospirillum]